LLGRILSKRSYKDAGGERDDEPENNDGTPEFEILMALITLSYSERTHRKYAHAQNFDNHEPRDDWCREHDCSSSDIENGVDVNGLVGRQTPSQSKSERSDQEEETSETLKESSDAGTSEKSVPRTNPLKPIFDNSAGSRRSLTFGVQ